MHPRARPAEGLVTWGVAVMPKRLIACCDGTWNTADQAKSGHPSPTNVTKLALSIAPEDAVGARQCVYYHSGVGTSRWERLSGGAFGVGLSRNVFDAYHFLIDNYESDDLLYLLGFSRGAFTARSLAGLIRNCGILRRENADRIDEAWALYRSSADTPSGVASTLFRRAYSYEPRIHFIGVWDTVGALGIPVLGPRWLKPIVTRLNHRWEFHDTKLSTRVKTRPELEKALKLAYDIKEAIPGQEVILTVHELKRLARNAELMTLSGQLQGAGVQLELLTGPLTGIYDPNGMGAMFFAVLAAAAQTEPNYIREKTLEGQVTAGAKGNHGGRPKVIDDDSLFFGRALKDRGVPVPEIAKKLTIKTGKNAGESPSVASL